MGNLVAFAGLDGSGKTTQVRLLGEWLGEQRVETALNAPTGPSFISKLLEDLTNYLHAEDLSEYMTDETACLLRAVVRYREWSQFLLPALDTAQFGLTDRYVPCYYASIRARNAGAEKVLRAIFRDLPKPALTIFLDVPPLEAYQRIQRRGVDLEKIDFLIAYEKAYRSLPEFDDFLVIDGQGSIEEVQQRIQVAMRKRFPAIAPIVENRLSVAHHAA